MMHKSKLINIYTLLLLLIASTVAISLVYQSKINASVSTKGMFKEVVPALTSYDLVDLGAVDINSDEKIDLFTTNHNQSQFLLVNNGEGQYTNAIYSLGLGHSADFPGVESDTIAPNTDRPGFYVYWHNSSLVLSWNPSSLSETLSGTMILSSEVEIIGESNFELDINQNLNTAGSASTSIKFTAYSKGRIEISPTYIAVPITFRLNNSIAVTDIHVGKNKVSPTTHEFQIALADRHGVAWTDYNGDGLLDLYITRGGLKGKMHIFKETFYDELFERTGLVFKNVIVNSKISKKNCPAYQVQWIDFNKDEALDLYISCQRGHANMLFVNDGTGSFAEIAPELGLNITTNDFHTPFLWIDLDNDKDLDILVHDNNQYVTFINKNPGFVMSSDKLQLPNISKMTVSDYDMDGDLDIFAASLNGQSALLINSAGKLTIKPASSLGLPAEALTANWVDYNNDGLVDLHVIPGGIYQQNAQHTFESTGILRHIYKYSIYNARASWVDLDNDGDRDLIMATQHKDPLYKQLFDLLQGKHKSIWRRTPQEWRIQFFHNDSQKHGNHWLQVSLQGHSGNPQAIGALVKLITDEQVIASQIGQADGSHFSQGHYRLYYGLGSLDKTPSIHIEWPNGQEDRYSNVKIDQLINITQ